MFKRIRQMFKRPAQGGICEPEPDEELIVRFEAPKPVAPFDEEARARLNAALKKVIERRGQQGQQAFMVPNSSQTDILESIVWKPSAPLPPFSFRAVDGASKSDEQVSEEMADWAKGVNEALKKQEDEEVSVEAAFEEAKARAKADEDRAVKEQIQHLPNYGMF